MKKNILMGAALAVLAVAAIGCSKSNDANKETTVVGVVEGSEVVMPENPDDTTVVAEGEAVVVNENAK